MESWKHKMTAVDSKAFFLVRQELLEIVFLTCDHFEQNLN